MKMPFGKHKGEDLASIPSGYLMWLAENVSDKPELIEEVEKQLRMRGGEGVRRGFEEDE